MLNLTFNKDSFDIEKINAELKKFYSQNNLDKEKLLTIELICEEFLSNILFPNFDGEIKMSVSQKDGDLVLSFEYKGINFMNKINEKTIISHKIFRSKTKDIISDTTVNNTSISFVI